jgi:predicted dehydrogenase
VSARLRVGIIGANPDSGWASRSHLPAVQASTDVELVAVATTSSASAEKAARVYGAQRAYSRAADLIADPDVDAVTVAVKVPEHAALTRAAIEAGKHVYCEWPLAATTDEAIALRDLARHRGVQTIVGLQSAGSIQVARARTLIADGTIGRLRSVTISCIGGVGGARYRARDAWRADVENGVDALTVLGGHALDTLSAVVGEIDTLSAIAARTLDAASIVETGETIPLSGIDQVALTGTVRGAVLSAHIQGGMPGGHGFLLQIRGTEGRLELRALPSLADAPLRLLLSNDRAELAEIEGDDDDHVGCVARLYADLASAVSTGTPRGPDFTHAVRRHRLLDAIRAASRDGKRIDVIAD